MKKKVLLLTMLILCLVNFNSNVVAQTTDINTHIINYDHSKNDLIKYENDFIIESYSILWDSIRPLTEVNKVDTADAYPYISQDGLRLYFTQGLGDYDNNIYYTSRSDINSNFNNTQLLSSNFPTGSFSCWLTNDELEIYYIYDFKLFYSSRTSMSSTFSTPAQINFVDNIEGYILGPSLTPDQQELYLFNWNEDQNIFILERTETLTYKIVDTLAVPSGLNAYPGQLSKGGLVYYFSMLDNYDSVKIYRMDRPNLSSQFGNLSVLDNTINSSKRTGQPSVTFGENELVFLTSDENSWFKNDLFIASHKTAGIVPEHVDNIDFVTVFPNPGKDKLNVNFILNKKAKVNFEICDLTGRTIINQANLYFNGENQVSFNINNLTKGIYLLNISIDNNLKAYKFIKTD